MKRTLIVSVLAWAVMMTTVSAFDDQRHGFVIGGGLGFCTSASWEAERPVFNPPRINDETGSGGALNVLMGYAWDNYNMIVMEANVVSFESEFGDLDGKKISQGFNGAVWYHYFGPQGASFYTAVGIGLYGWDVEAYRRNDAGGAILLGAGYEFTKHVQVGGYLSAGETSSTAVTVKHNHFSILVSAVAF